MKIAHKEYTFGFTAYVWHEIYEKSCIFHQVEDLVKEFFTITDYTSDIKKIIFSICINPQNVDEILQPISHYAWNKKLIEIYGKIDFQTFLDANPQDALALMCQSYLDAINSIPSLRGMKKVHFDTQKLHQDLRRLFVEKGFLN